MSKLKWHLPFVKKASLDMKYISPKERPWRSSSLVNLQASRLSKLLHLDNILMLFINLVWIQSDDQVLKFCIFLGCA